MSKESELRADRPAEGKKEDADNPRSSGSLAVLYEGMFTRIVRLQSSRQQIPDIELFRSGAKSSLQEIEQVAVSAGYDGPDINDTHLAVVALLDSVVLHSSDPIRTEWERRSLGEELFGRTDLGVVVFDKLGRFHTRRDSEKLASILEVYLLCLLLGFEGRYSGGLRADLDTITKRTRNRIDEIRGRNPQISPAGVPLIETSADKLPQAKAPNRLPWIALAAVIVSILLFIALKIDLVSTSSQVLNTLH